MLKNRTPWASCLTLEDQRDYRVISEASKRAVDKKGKVRVVQYLVVLGIPSVTLYTIALGIEGKWSLLDSKELLVELELEVKEEEYLSTYKEFEGNDRLELLPENMRFASVKDLIKHLKKSPVSVTTFTANKLHGRLLDRGRDITKTIKNIEAYLTDGTLPSAY